MKIKDVINEAGFLNRLGAGIRGAVGAVQQNRAQRAADPNAAVRQQVRAANLKQELAAWKQDMAKFSTRVDMTNPANFQQVLKQWVNTRYPEATVNGRDAADIATVKPNNSSSIANYISTMYNAAMDAPTAAPAPKTSQDPAADYVKLDPEVKVIKAVDPVILQFSNKRYTLQPNGQWTKLGQTKPVDVPMQQFLNSELAKL